MQIILESVHLFIPYLAQESLPPLAIFSIRDVKNKWVPAGMENLLLVV